MATTVGRPVVHLELHTGNLPRACSFYSQLFGWRPVRVSTPCGSTYLSMDLGNGMEGGIVEHDTEHALWLPYVEVADVSSTTERARCLGATVPLEPREGPAGWRAVVAPPAGAAVALWQAK